MGKPAKAAMSRHDHDWDWCHLCGERSRTTADVWYPENAEHHPPAGVCRGRYIRICADCGRRIAAVATGPGLTEDARPAAHSRHR